MRKQVGERCLVDKIFTSIEPETGVRLAAIKDDDILQKVGIYLGTSKEKWKRSVMKCEE